MPRKQRGERLWRNRIVGHAEVSPEQLLAHPDNWRIHPEAQQQALSDVLDRVGFVSEVIVNKTTGHVVDGHLRVLLALRREEPTIPVKYVALTEEEEKLVLASFDPISAAAGTDSSKLETLLAELALPEGALEDLLSGLVPDAEGYPEPEDADLGLAVPGPHMEIVQLVMDKKTLHEYRAMVPRFAEHFSASDETAAIMEVLRIAYHDLTHDGSLQRSFEEG